MPTKALKSLHALLVDAEKGYEEAIKVAEVGEMKALFEKVSSSHQRAHRDVHSILVSRGERPNDLGSFMSVVNRTVISVRSAVTGLDRSSLNSFASGEEHIVSAYDQAISEHQDDPPVAAALQKHKNELVSMIDELKRNAS